MLGSDAVYINDNADLNTFLTPGNFKCNVSSRVATLKNCPVSEAFIMRVYYSTGSVGSGYLYIGQEIRTYREGHLVIRLYVSEPGAAAYWRTYEYSSSRIS